MFNFNNHNSIDMVLFYLGIFWFYLASPLSDRNIEQTFLEEFRIIEFSEFEKTLNTPSDKLRIFNFWATWCAPCIKEMPYFESVISQDPDVELFFISLDDGRNPERVTNFISKRKIKAPVYLLDEVDFNKWIGKVDKDWSGAIPATLFIKPDGSRSFHEGELSEEELKQLIKQ